MQKRRNISFGGAGNNNYIEQRSILDLDNSVNGGNRVSRPSINNSTFDTFDNSNQSQKPTYKTSNVTPSNKFNMNVIRSNESAFSNRDSRDYNGQQVPVKGSLKKNHDMMANKYHNSEQQASHKYPNYIEELLLNSQ